MNNTAALTAKTVHIKKNRERETELYFVVYAGSDASLANGAPLVAKSHVIEGVKRGEVTSFPGLGVMVLPEIEIRGGLVAWHVQLWESDDKHRRAGEALEVATNSVDFGHPLIGALAGASGGAAIQAIGHIAEGAGKLLEGNGDDLLMTWAGSLYADQLPMFSGALIPAESEKARVEFQLLTNFETEA